MTQYNNQSLRIKPTRIVCDWFLKAHSYDKQIQIVLPWSSLWSYHSLGLTYFRVITWKNSAMYSWYFCQHWVSPKHFYNLSIIWIGWDPSKIIQSKIFQSFALFPSMDHVSHYEDVAFFYDVLPLYSATRNMFSKYVFSSEDDWKELKTYTWESWNHKPLK